MGFATEANNVLGGQKGEETRLKGKVRVYCLQLKYLKLKVKKRLTKRGIGKSLQALKNINRVFVNILEQKLINSY